jgi:hypothetical protein
LARSRAGWLLRAPDSADFFVADDLLTVTVSSLPGVDPGTIEHLLIDHVLPRLLAHQGALMLHASAVEIGPGVALFLGESGRGKSTLATMLQAQGHRVLSDDCVLVNANGSAITVLPAYSSLRLLPDVLEHFHPAGASTGLLAGYGRKRGLPVLRPRLPLNGLPVTAMYVLEEATPTGSECRVERLSPSRRAIELTKGAYRLDPTDLRGAGNLLAEAARVARAVPAFSLHYPRDLAALPAFAECVSDHAGGEALANGALAQSLAMCVPPDDEVTRLARG